MIDLNMRNGYSLVEVVIGIGLLAILAPVIVGAVITSREGRPQAERRQEATTILNDTIDSVRSVRERGWALFAVNGTWHPVQDGSQWSLVAGAETIGNFTRRVTISDVYRDSNGTIVIAGGTRDPSTRRVLISVSWNTPLPASVSTEMYYTRYSDNETLTHTTAADFNGTTTSTAVTDLYDGGEVVLASGGYGNWCNPVFTDVTVDLPKNGTANAISATEGIIFVGTGENSSGVSFARVNVDQGRPPAAVIAGTFNGYKTNDIFGDGNFAYVATDNNSKEVVKINVSTTPYTEVGAFNGYGSTDADAVFISGAYGYVTQNRDFRVFNVNTMSQVGTRTLSGRGTDIKVVGNYAYVSIAGAARELEIVNISNPSNPTISGWADVNGAASYGVIVNGTGTRAYIVTGADANQPELFIINTESKSGSRPIIASYDTSGMDPNGVAVVPGNLAVIVGDNAEEYQVINITDETNLRRCGGAEVNTGIRGVSFVLESDGDAFSYIITGDSNSELKIIGGGLGGAFTGNGMYESAPFTVGYPVAFNRMIWNATIPSQTAFRMQIAVANPTFGSDCGTATYTYVGPGGDTGTWFDTGAEAVVPFGSYGASYINPGQCMRYRVNLLANEPANTPIFRDVTINYSP
ncbi:MAG: hypothetical protein N2691_06040 [Patescibacteria group bacterium]|nr:hypothetical protein [Patescibacteria group bacterium]